MLQSVLCSHVTTISFHVLVTGLIYFRNVLAFEPILGSATAAFE